MHIPAKVDYALRALLELASRNGTATAESLAGAQNLPTKFLAAILSDVRRAGLIISRRGLDGGYRLSRPASQITVADVIRAIDGPVAEVHGLRPEMDLYQGAAEHLEDVWISTRATLCAVLETISLDNIIKDQVPRQGTKVVAGKKA
jgi:Rrf2 family protein